MCESCAPPTYDSPYQAAYERLESVRRRYGAWGERVAVEALVYAADVDFGVRLSTDGSPQFAFEAGHIATELLKLENPTAICEQRLADAEGLLLRYAEPRDVPMLQGLRERDMTLAAITVGLPLRLRPGDLRARLVEAPPREMLFVLELPRDEV